MIIDLGELRSELILGESKHLLQISKSYGPPCIRFLYSKHKCDEESAREIFTDALLIFRDSVIQNKVKEVKNLQNYLIGICMNVFRRNLRENKRKIDKVEDVRRELYGEESNYLERTIEKEMFQGNLQLTMKTFRQLDLSCQEILRLYYVEELSMKEIANELGLASNDVAKTKKSRCYRRWLQYVDELTQK